MFLNFFAYVCACVREKFSEYLCSICYTVPSWHRLPGLDFLRRALHHDVATDMVAHYYFEAHVLKRTAQREHIQLLRDVAVFLQSLRQKYQLLVQLFGDKGRNAYLCTMDYTNELYGKTNS